MVRGSVCYSTLQPCMTCAKQLLQAGVSQIVFAESFNYTDPAIDQQYRKLLAQFPVSEALEPIAVEWLPGLNGRPAEALT